MGHIIDYLHQYGDIPFSKKPFHEADALILAQFSYLKLQGVVPKLTDQENGITLLAIKEKMDETVVFADERFKKDNQKLFYAMVSGRRFQNMRCNYYADILNEDMETQFSAMTCFLEGALPVMVYRGTDENIIGWKEDFNMAFRKPVTGQSLSVMYMNQTGMRLDGAFLVCGHSKGGNFAVYSAMHAAKDIQDRIQTVYSFDGPGFRPEILESGEFAAIKDRVRKLIPHSSFIGMLLENHEQYEVVESSAFGILQHNPYTWIMDQDTFRWADDVYQSKKIMNKSLNEWILSLSDEQLSAFIDTLFLVIEENDVKTTIEITSDWKKSVTGILNAMKNVDEKTQETIREMIQKLFEVVRDHIKDNHKKSVKFRKKPL